LGSDERNKQNRHERVDWRVKRETQTDQTRESSLGSEVRNRQIRPEREVWEVRRETNRTGM